MYYKGFLTQQVTKYTMGCITIQQKIWNKYFNPNSNVISSASPWIMVSLRWERAGRLQSAQVLALSKKLLAAVQGLYPCWAEPAVQSCPSGLAAPGTHPPFCQAPGGTLAAGLMPLITLNQDSPAPLATPECWSQTCSSP